MEVTLKNKTKKNQNMKFKKNQITTVFGLPGSRKNKIFNLLSQTRKNQTVEILFNGKTLEKKELKKMVGIIKENQIFKQETIREEFIETLKKHNYKAKNQEKRIKDSVHIINLKENYLDINPNNLSDGEKTKLSIALTLSYNPKVIIIKDDNLDSYNKKELIKLLRLMKIKYNKTIILFTQDVEFAHSISDYIYIINNGNIITKGNKYEVFTNFKLLKENNIKPPKIIDFVHLIEVKKNVKIGYRDDINDLIKDIYRFIR